MTFYKTVKVINNKKYSLMSYSFSHPAYRIYKIEYIPHKWIKAKVGKIFIRGKREDALHFARFSAFVDIDDVVEVWEVEAKNPQLPPKYILTPPDFRYIRKFWKKLPTTFSTYLMIPTRSTMVADAIKLTKKIKTIDRTSYYYK